jgi:hypothetical protein
MDKNFEDFIRFRCEEILIEAGIDVDKINMDACISSYKEGFKVASKISPNEK